ncbi:putative exported protein [Piscinibacter sakaiensis]|uniref:Putative exported protein n=1 Tax=Piscinibacter sakaiensis TaxID=1547922 RepID=A0A0K8P578_PISS1|nr:putative exported protein [Piscinibacter sakaiensis]
MVPYAAGGSLDVTTRTLVAALAPRLGRRVDVVDLPGASGLFAARRVLRAPVDGCTLLSATISQVGLLPLQNTGAGFAPEQFMAVARTGSVASYLVVSARSSVHRLSDLSTPGSAWRAGNLGPESLQALLLQRLERAARTEFIQVPFAGAAALAQALEGDHIDLAILAQPALAGLLPRGQVRIVAGVGQGEGEPAVAWSGLFAASGTDPGWAKAVSGAVEQAMADPAVAASLQRLGVDTRPPSMGFSDEVAQSVAWLRSMLPPRTGLR